MDSLKNRAQVVGQEENDLLAEIERLKKVNQALMERVEKGLTLNGKASFDLFQKNALLSDAVKKRTHKLNQAILQISKEKEKFSDIVQALPGALFFANGDLTKLETVCFNEIGLYDDNASIFNSDTEKQIFLDEIKSELGRNPSFTKHHIFKYYRKSQGKTLLFNCSITKKEKQFVIYAQDQSELQEKEEVIKFQQDQIYKSAKLATIGEMAGSIVHEINNPLTVLNCSLSLFKKHYDRNELDIPIMLDVIKDMSSMVTRMTKIISSVRNISHNSGRVEITANNFDDIVSDISSLCESRLRKNSIVLKKTFDPSITIHCDRVQISQVLVNLISNSLDAIEECIDEKWIEISHQMNDEYDIISVTDSGLGIPNESAEHLFETFYTTKQVGMGSGFGLPISRKIMDAHQGKIEFDPSSKNTRFVLKIPRK